MSGDNNKPNPHAAERQEANEQNGSIDGIAGITSAVNPFGSAPVRGVHFGKTSFEGYDLNEMIDIVESASPELLESAATALVDARDAIKEAADELKTNLGEVDWEGEAHSAFFKWGQSLVTTAHDLAGYADVVGTQILAAGSGLASVRKSMPPRDSRSDRKTVDDIPESKRVESNDEYAAALKAEKHRQEAINQMYRLASYYAVSQGTMSKAEEPVFPKMPDVGVPQPPPGYQPPDTGMPPTKGYLRGTPDSGGVSHHVTTEGAAVGSGDSLPTHKGVTTPAGLSDRNVGTEIDSVRTLLPTETANQTPVSLPPADGQSGKQYGLPSVPTAVPPVQQGQVGRFSAGGPIGRDVPAVAQGRVSGFSRHTSPGRVGPGNVGPVGPAAQGQAPGRTAAGPVGRGVVGGTPVAGRPVTGAAPGPMRGPVSGPGVTNSGRTGSGRTGVGRPTDGIAGGRPVGVPPAGGAGGPKVPRGTVVGEEGFQAGRPRGERPGNRGVIGADSESGSSRGGHAPGAREVPRGVVGEQRPNDPRSRRGDRRDRPESSE
jgi:uncharacterized protein YukE